MKKGCKRIIFFQTPGDVYNYVKNDKRGTSDDLSIAMKPSVRAYAKKHNIFSESTLKYLASERHSELSLEGKRMTDWIRRNAKFVDTEFKITNGYLNTLALFLKYAINYCILAIEVISVSCSLNTPERISVSSGQKSYRRRRYITPLDSLFIQPEENTLAILAKGIAENEGIVFEDLAGIDAASVKSSFFSGFKKYAVSPVLLSFLYIAYRLERALAVLKDRITRKTSVLFTTKAGYMLGLAGLLKKERGLSAHSLRESLIPVFDSRILNGLFFKRRLNFLTRQRELLLEFAEKIANEKELFSHKGVTFAHIIADKFQRDIMPYIIGLNVWTAELDNIIRGLRPSLVLSSGNRIDDVITGELCRRMNIPSLFISHGSFSYPKDEIERAEWGEHGRNLFSVPYSFIGLQTPLSEGYLKIFPPEGRPIKTGPLIWGKKVDLEKSRLLFGKMLNGKYGFKKDIKVIVHAGTAKSIRSLRFHIYETPDEYIQSLIDLVGAVDGIPDAILVIRFRPFPEAGIDDLKTFLPASERVIISTDGAFGDVLGMADLLVSFSSTTIEEALQNRIPVLCYGGDGRYQHVAAREIKTGDTPEPSAVYHIKRAGDLTDGLRKILNMNLRGPGHESLFNQYIYAEKDRIQLLNLIKDMKKAG